MVGSLHLEEQTLKLDSRRPYSMPTKINTKCCNLATYLHSNYFQSSLSPSRSPKTK